MILGIGTDIIAIERIAAVFSRYGDTFARKILVDAEVRLLQRHQKPQQFLASRFAAKEAAVKALGTGMRLGISFSDITIEADNLGQPAIIFSGAALQRAEQLAVKRSHLSLTHEKQYALAFVVLEA